MHIESKPNFPAISISDDGALVVVTNEDGFKKASTLALLDVSFLQDTNYYDSQGQKWKLNLSASTLKRNVLTRILANTFYNPLHQADLKWNWISKFDISELKQNIQICIQKDDDVLTQFVEGEVIRSAIDGANDFQEILSVLDRLVFSVEDR